MRVGTWIFWPRRGRDRRGCVERKENGHQRVVARNIPPFPRSTTKFLGNEFSLFSPPYICIYMYIISLLDYTIIIYFPAFLQISLLRSSFYPFFPFRLVSIRFKKPASWKIRESLSLPKSPFSKDNRDDGDCRGGGRPTIERGLS